MALTRRELINEIAANLAEPNLDPRIETWLDIGLERLNRHYDFRDSLQITTISDATTADTETYDVEDDWSLTGFKHFYDLRLMDGVMSRKLHQRLARRHDELHPDASVEATGRPEFYTLFGKTIILNPIPDDAYDVKAKWVRWLYWKNSAGTHLTAPVDTAYLEVTHCDDLLIALCTARGFQGMRGELAMAEATKWHRIWTGLLDEAIQAEEMMPDFDMRRVPWFAERGSVAGSSAEEWSVVLGELGYGQGGYGE
uniref:Uncharacterized protein n=1 Tax=viral metagenome TaxID=1070528 RepID=A0A6M3JWU1_9ZZZZ